MHRIFPNGSIGVLALILSMIGYFMGVGGNNGCAFGTVVLTGGELDYASGSVGWGIWNRESPENQEYVCNTYTSTEESLLVDGKWRASRAMAVFANVCGGVCMIICICLSCVSIPKTFLKITSLLSFTAGSFSVWYSFGSRAMLVVNTRVDSPEGQALLLVQQSLICSILLSLCGFLYIKAETMIFDLLLQRP